MTERARVAEPRFGWLWPILLLGLLAVAVLADRAASPEQLRLANPDLSRVSEVRAALAAMPARPMVLVAMDPDLGTYPEIRGAVRAAFEDLLARDARLAMVSFTPEGRAIATAELERLAAGGVPAERLLDLGFVAGAEAGLVLAVTDFEPPEGSEALRGPFASAGGGIAAFDLALVVGGVDFGPRSWVEQVTTRVPELPIIALVPTFMQPEVAPYLRTGQLSGLLGTLRDAAAYSRGVAPGLTESAAARLDRGISPLAMLAGMLVALAFVGRALYRGGGPGQSFIGPEPDEAS